MRENADQNKSEYGHFFCAVQYSPHIQHWWDFCSYWNANPFTASFNDDAKFLTQHFLRLECEYSVINLLSTNPTRWSNTLKQFVGNFPTNCLILFDHFVRLALRINTAKSALSSIFFFDNVLTFGKWTIIQSLLKGMFKERPTFTRYTVDLLRKASFR